MSILSATESSSTQQVSHAAVGYTVVSQTRGHIVHVTSSRFFGGPERQMLELAREFEPDVATSFLSFSEDGLCEAFLNHVRNAGFVGVRLHNDTPHLIRARKELRQKLAEMRPTVLCVHGYKAGLLGLSAARSLGVPVIAVSRGWTAECWKVRLYERLDRIALRHMDRVVCVSHGQAAKVRRAGVDLAKISVIHNSIRTNRFERPRDDAWRHRLDERFNSAQPTFIVGAAGRLSPEKGFEVLVDAVRLAREQDELNFGVVLFGDGPLKADLQKRIDNAGIGSHFVLAGFTDELDRFMPHFDLFVQSSHTEGLPNVLLEAAAAGVPVVATDVGGTREVVVDGETGLVVPPADAPALAQAVTSLLQNPKLRQAMGERAKTHVRDQFTFAAQAAAYRHLFEQATKSRLAGV